MCAAILYGHCLITSTGAKRFGICRVDHETQQWTIEESADWNSNVITTNAVAEKMEKI